MGWWANSSAFATQAGILERSDLSKWGGSSLRKPTWRGPQGGQRTRINGQKGFTESLKGQISGEFLTTGPLTTHPRSSPSDQPGAMGEAPATGLSQQSISKRRPKNQGLTGKSQTMETLRGSADRGEWKPASNSREATEPDQREHPPRGIAGEGRKNVKVKA